MTLLVEPLLMPKLKVPFPVMAGVTSNSTQVFRLTAPTLLKGVPLRGGALLQVNPLSVQGVLVPA